MSCMFLDEILTTKMKNSGSSREKKGAVYYGRKCKWISWKKQFSDRTVGLIREENNKERLRDDDQYANSQ